MIDINPYHLEIVTQILLEHVPDCEVRAFGSRATWTSKDYSDLDLAIVGNGPLEWRTLGKLRDAFEESYLPFRVDVLDWHDISDNFREIIREDCIVIFKKNYKHEWGNLTLGQCIEIENSNYSEKEAWPFINYLDTGNITTNVIKEVQHLVTGTGKIPTRARRKIQPGDIVYSMVRPNQRHFGLIKHPPENFVVSTGFAVLRGKPDVAYTDFIYYLLTQDHIVDYLQAIAENSTSAYPSIRPHDLEQLEIQLPSLPKQRDIARILNTLDEKIELNRRTNETLEAMTQTLFKSWFLDFAPVRAKMEGRWQPGESFPGFPAHLYDLFPDRLIPSELGEIPEGWLISCVTDLCNKIENGGTPTRSQLHYWGGPIPWYTTSELTDGPLLHSKESITREGLAKSTCKLWQSGTILIALYASPTVGRLGILETQATANQACSALVPNYSYFRYYLFYSLFFSRTQLQRIAVGAAQQNISQNIVRSLKIIVPPIEIVTIFNRIIKDLWKKRMESLNELYCMVALRDLMLPQLISGNLL